MTLEPNTRIEFHGTPAVPELGFPGVAPEGGTVLKPKRVNLPLPGQGWHIVRFDSGGTMCVHESRFRVISNRQ